MEIRKIIGSMGVPGQSPQKSAEKNGGFDEVLKNKVNDLKAADANPQAAPSAADSVLPTQSPGLAQVNGAQFHRANKVLDLLDNYANALRDPKRTLKSIEPILQQLQEEVNQLLPEAPQTDEGLRNVINDIAVTAKVEAVKFHRGDYTS
jgi:hypothetical protein